MLRRSAPLALTVPADKSESASYKVSILEKKYKEH